MKRSTDGSKTRTPTIQKLSPKQFTLLAIERLRPDADKGKAATGGIHVVWSVFNEAFRAYFPGLNPVEEMQDLAKAGVIRIFRCRGGVVINTPEAVERYKKNKKRSKLPKRAVKALEKMGVD